jgi:hypothetical protein
VSETYDPNERFSLDEDPEDVLKKLLGADEDEPEEGTES